MSQRELLLQLLSQIDPAGVQALVIGAWSADESPAQYLQTLFDQRLPALRALFVGDMSGEDAEISWIRQCDYSDSAIAGLRPCATAPSSVA